jgi:hypothetical protein
VVDHQHLAVALADARRLGALAAAGAAAEGGGEAR